MGVKPKMKFSKKWWFGVVVVVIIIIGALGSGGSEENTNTSNDTTSQPAAADTTTTIETKSEEAKKEEPKKELELDFSKVDLTKENITKAISKVVGENKLKSVDITVEDGKNIIDISYNPGDVWDEKALVKNNAVTATNVMEILFKNPKVDKIWVWTETEMQDAKGNNSMQQVVNVCLTKENAKDINWTNFKTKVANDYKALFNIADSSYIHPGIAKELE